MYKQYKCAWRHSNTHCILVGKPKCEGCSYFEEAQHKHKGYDAIIQRRGWYGRGIDAWVEIDYDKSKDYTVAARYCPACGREVAIGWSKVRRPEEKATKNG